MLDKLLALRGGAELVALWAQLASVMELVSGVALAGVGTGIAVYVARTRRPARQRDLLREALRLALLVSLPVALVTGACGLVFGEAIAGGKVPAPLFAIGAAAGWVAVVPGIVNGYWLGQQCRDAMLALALGSALASVAVAAAAPREHLLWMLAAAQAVPALTLLPMIFRKYDKPRFRAHSHPLRRYIVPGLSIGLFSPLSMILARGTVGEALSWHDAGVLQALWRAADWVGALAGGVLAVYYLPRFTAAAASPERLRAELAHAARWVLLPCAAVLFLLLLAQRPLLAVLYDPTVRASDLAAALVFAGAVARIAAWIPLFALYAQRRAWAISVGEVLSLPLFAALLITLSARMSLELAGALWVASFLAYCAFNAWAARPRA